MTTWHVLGAGALGGLWAAGLAKAGHRVELLLKNPGKLELFQRDGVIIIQRGEKQERVSVTASVSRTGTTTIDHLLVTTKAHQTMAALKEAAPRLMPGCRVLLVQNGMGVAEQIAENYADIDLFCGVTTDGAWCPQPFAVVHAAVGETSIGSHQGTAAVAPLLKALPNDVLHIDSCRDIRDRQWQKLAINCAVNGLTAVYQCRNGDLLTLDAAKKRLVTLSEEIACVGEVLGYADWKDKLPGKIETVLRLTADNYSSMCQDIRQGRTTEIDYLNGYLIARAKQAGIACPENEKLYQQIKQMEETGSGPV